MKEPTLQTTMFRWSSRTLVVRMPIVVYRKREFEPHSLSVMKGPHRLWIVLFPPRGWVNAMSGPKSKILRRVILWQWEQQPGCEYCEVEA